MASSLLNFLCYLVLMCYLSGNNNAAMEFPNYRVVRSESDFEIRLYNESSWMSASVTGTSFNLSTHIGFHRLYQYIHGANMNSSRLAFTAPILTSIATSSSSSSHGNNYIDYTVRFYISRKYQGKPPQPNPELKLHLDKWVSDCIAVRKFSGFARDDTIEVEVEGLVNSMDKKLPGYSAEKGSYTIAQYNDSHEVSGRLNEVWMSVSAQSLVDCPHSSL